MDVSYSPSVAEAIQRFSYIDTSTSRNTEAISAARKVLHNAIFQQSPHVYQQRLEQHSTERIQGDFLESDHSTAALLDIYPDIDHPARSLYFEATAAEINQVALLASAIGGDIAGYQSLIDHLEEGVYRLKEQQQQYRSFLAPIRMVPLPTELWTLIFDEAAGGGSQAAISSTQALVRISHVCSRWRSIVKSTTSLWVKFSSDYLSLAWRRNVFACHMAILTALSSARAQPLTLHSLSITIPRRLDGREVKPEVREQMRETMKDIRRLSLVSSNHDGRHSTYKLLETLCITSTLPRLQCLEMEQVSGELFDTTILARLPSLTHLSLQGEFRFRQSWEFSGGHRHLTSLVLNPCLVETAEKVLPYCSEAVEVRLALAEPLILFQPPTVVSPITHIMIEAPVNASFGSADLLDMLVLPKLRHLELCSAALSFKAADPEREDEILKLVSFFGKGGFGSSLLALKLDNIFLTEEPLLQLLSLVSKQLDSLEICDRQLAVLPSGYLTPTFIDALTPWRVYPILSLLMSPEELDSWFYSDGQGCLLFPRLQHLALRVFTPHISKILELVECRSSMMMASPRTGSMRHLSSLSTPGVVSLAQKDVSFLKSFSLRIPLGHLDEATMAPYQYLCDCSAAIASIDNQEWVQDIREQGNVSMNVEVFIHPRTVKS